MAFNRGWLPGWELASSGRPDTWNPRVHVYVCVLYIVNGSTSKWLLAAVEEMKTSKHWRSFISLPWSGKGVPTREGTRRQLDILLRSTFLGELLRNHGFKG